MYRLPRASAVQRILPHFQARGFYRATLQRRYNPLKAHLSRRKLPASPNQLLLSLRFQSTPTPPVTPPSSQSSISTQPSPVAEAAQEGQRNYETLWIGGLALLTGILIYTGMTYYMDLRKQRQQKVNEIASLTETDIQQMDTFREQEVVRLSEKLLNKFRPEDDMLDDIWVNRPAVERAVKKMADSIDRSLFYIAYGEKGRGKTAAFNHVLKGRPGVILVELHPGDSADTIIGNILRVLSGKGWNRQSYGADFFGVGDELDFLTDVFKAARRIYGVEPLILMQMGAEAERRFANLAKEVGYVAKKLACDRRSCAFVVDTHGINFTFNFMYEPRVRFFSVPEFEPGEALELLKGHRLPGVVDGIVSDEQRLLLNKDVFRISGTSPSDLLNLCDSEDARIDLQLLEERLTDQVWDYFVDHPDHEVAIKKMLKRSQEDGLTCREFQKELFKYWSRKGQPKKGVISRRVIKKTMSAYGVIYYDMQKARFIFCSKSIRNAALKHFTMPPVFVDDGDDDEEQMIAYPLGSDEIISRGMILTDDVDETSSQLDQIMKPTTSVEETTLETETTTGDVEQSRTSGQEADLGIK